MARRRKPPPRWSRPAAEAAAVMVAIALAFAAGFAGFVVGRETAEDDEPTAAETAQTTTEATTAETETEPATTEAETAPTETGPDTPTETSGGDDEEAQGEAVFASAGCGSCHTFEPAGATGTIGPDLGQTDLNEDEIAQVVRNGRGGMPSFEGRLSDSEIEAVAAYVDGGG